MIAAARTTARVAAEIVLTTSGLAALSRRRMHDAIAILAYHNVVAPADAGRGDASLHLPLDRFIRQIERLARTHDIIDIEDAAAPPGKGRPRAIITFDDAYRGAVTLALPELVKRGIPAVMFVAPALIDAQSTWWDEMAEADLLTTGTRDFALESLAGRTSGIRSRYFAYSPPSLPSSYGIASIGELRRHCANSVRVGSHTWAHEYLPSLGELELRANFARTLQWLDAWDGPTSRWLALPYGGGDGNVGRLALEAGHTGVLGISGGMWSDDAQRAQVPRINVPAGMSQRGLELRTSGLKH